MCKPALHLGFTLQELLTVMVVSLLLAAYAIPGMIDFIAGNRMAAQSNEVVGALRLARSMAIARGVPVSVCASKAGQKDRCADGDASHTWSSGWIVFINSAGSPSVVDSSDTLLRVYPELVGGSELSASAMAIHYRPDGIPQDGSVTWLLRSPRCSATANREIIVSAQGLVSVTHVTC